MHIEDIHKHADLDGLTLQVGIAGPLHRYDSPVGGRDHGVRVARHMRRRESSVGAPARFSRMKSFAYSPDWMRASAERIAFLVSSVMIFGPVAYSPYSALFEIE